MERMIFDRQLEENRKKVMEIFEAMKNGQIEEEQGERMLEEIQRGPSASSTAEVFEAMENGQIEEEQGERMQRHGEHSSYERARAIVNRLSGLIEVYDRERALVNCSAFCETLERAHAGVKSLSGPIADYERALAIMDRSTVGAPETLEELGQNEQILETLGQAEVVTQGLVPEQAQHFEPEDRHEIDMGYVVHGGQEVLDEMYMVRDELGGEDVVEVTGGGGMNLNNEADALGADK